MKKRSFRYYVSQSFQGKIGLSLYVYVIYIYNKYNFVYSTYIICMYIYICLCEGYENVMWI